MFSLRIVLIHRPTHKANLLVTVLIQWNIYDLNLNSVYMVYVTYILMEPSWPRSNGSLSNYAISVYTKL